MRHPDLSPDGTGAGIRDWSNAGARLSLTDTENGGAGRNLADLAGVEHDVALNGNFVAKPSFQCRGECHACGPDNGQGMAKVVVAEVNNIIATVARCVAYGNILNFALGAPIIGKYIICGVAH